MSLGSSVSHRHRDQHYLAVVGPLGGEHVRRDVGPVQDLPADAFQLAREACSTTDSANAVTLSPNARPAS